MSETNPACSVLAAGETTTPMFGTKDCAFSALTGAWTTLAANVQDSGAVVLVGRVAGMDGN